MDNILVAMKGHRIFDRFGFDLPKAPKKPKKTTILEQYQELKFDPKLSDWINIYTDEVLSGYILSHELEFLLTNKIDKELT